jgi:transposase
MVDTIRLYPPAAERSDRTLTVVETIAKIRRAHFVDGKSIKQICRELRVSRNTVRKVIRSGATEFTYDRTTQPRPKIDPLAIGSGRDAGRECPATEAGASDRHSDLRRAAEPRLWRRYDAIRRYAAGWSKVAQEASASAYVPLSFDAGEAYQFDWSHEIVILDGVTVTVKVAHVRLCHSRMPFVRAYPRETQEMVFDAHDRAFAFFGGACARGIYDNMKTAVDTIFVGKDRAYNRRFQQMCGHYLVDPVACTPASGWEKGQVENQVGVLRRRFFVPRPKFKSFAELNAWLGDRCIAYAKANRHPDIPDKTIWEVFEEGAVEPGAVWSVRSMDSTPSRRRCPRPASCASTRTATRSTPVRSGGPSRSAPMPTAWNAGRTVRSWGGMSAPSVAARRSTIRFITSRFWRANQAPCATEPPSRDWGPATGPAPGSAQARTPARRRPAGGRDPRGRAHRRAGGRRSRLLRGFGPQRPFRRRRSEHPGASPRTATAPDNHDAGCTEVGAASPRPIAIATTA